MKLLTVKEVAKVLRVADITIYKWVEQNKIPYIKVGGTIRITDKALTDLINKRQL